MPATHTVCHLHLGQVEELGTCAQHLASHGVLQESRIGHVRGWKPESHVGSHRLLLVGRLRFHHLLPFHELRQLLLVVLTEVLADCFSNIRKLSFITARISHEIAHHAAHFLPREVGIHEFGSTDVCTENRENHRNDRFVHVI